MEDAEFINYCRSHSETERAGFVPENIERILRLAGRDNQADKWRGMGHQIVSVPADVMHPVCDEAQRRLIASV